MHFVHRSLMRFVWLAFAALLAVAVAPTASRLLAASDPVRAAALAEICSAGMTALVQPLSDAPDSPDPGAVGGGHCLLCLSAAMGFAWPEPDRRADHAPPARHLQPTTASLLPPGLAPVWPSAPSRAPPSRA